MAKVIIYTTENCGYCAHAKQLLDKKGIKYSEIRVDASPELREEMMKLSGRRTVPQIFINNQSIGGFDELWNLEKNGQLDVKLAEG